MFELWPWGRQILGQRRQSLRILSVAWLQLNHNQRGYIKPFGLESPSVEKEPVVVVVSGGLDAQAKATVAPSPSPSPSPSPIPAPRPSRAATSWLGRIAKSALSLFTMGYATPKGEKRPAKNARLPSSGKARRKLQVSKATNTSTPQASALPQPMRAASVGPTSPPRAAPSPAVRSPPRALPATAAGPVFGTPLRQPGAAAPQNTPARLHGPAVSFTPSRLASALAPLAQGPTPVKTVLATPRTNIKTAARPVRN